MFPPNIYPTYADDAVPTSIAIGPDGAYYVGELTGFPLVLNAANILRVGRSGHESDVCLTGFTQVIDLTFDRKTGDLYVLEFQGSVVRVRPAPRGSGPGKQRGYVRALRRGAANQSRQRSDDADLRGGRP